MHCSVHGQTVHRRRWVTCVCNTVPYCTVQYNTCTVLFMIKQFIEGGELPVFATLYPTVQYSTVQYMHCSVHGQTVHRRGWVTCVCNTVPNCTVQYSTIQCNAIQCNTIQRSTIQYSAMQCNTRQYNAVQYNTNNTIEYKCSFFCCSGFVAVLTVKQVTEGVSMCVCIQYGALYHVVHYAVQYRTICAVHYVCHIVFGKLFSDKLEYIH